MLWDGTSYKLTVGRFEPQSHWVWENEGPAQWKALVGFANDVCAEFERRLAAQSGATVP